MPPRFRLRPPRRPRFTVSGTVVGLASTGLAAVTVLSPELTTDPYASTVPSAQQTVGTCHFFRTDQQMVQPSDVGAPVDCGSPHQAETFARYPVKEEVTGLAVRPEPEQLWRAGSCLTPEAGEAMRQYVGQDKADVLYGMSMWSRYPTRADWAAGDREIRCDVVGPPNDEYGNTLVSHSWKDFARTRASSAIRLCMREGTELTCDKEHDWEAVNAAFTLDGFHDQARLTAEATKRCEPFVTSYLGANKGYNTPRIPERNAWERGDRVVKCGVAAPDGVVRGTLKAGLR